MQKTKLVLALLISIVFGTTVSVLEHRNHTLVRQLDQQNQQLTHTQTELAQAKEALRVAEAKLGFLEKYKTTVQVTAFTKQPNSHVFANGRSIYKSYAVPKRTLPEDAVVSIALSPAAQRRLHARMNDFIVIMDKHSRKKTLARFVDTTDANEQRSVVDVYFSNPSDARVWGRRYNYVAVNISMANSPFKQY